MGSVNPPVGPGVVDVTHTHTHTEEEELMFLRRGPLEEDSVLLVHLPRLLSLFFCKNAHTENNTMTLSGPIFWM